MKPESDEDSDFFDRSAGGYGGDNEDWFSVASKDMANSS